MTVEQISQLHRARGAAHACAKATADLADFLERAEAEADAARLVEYAALLAREESAREARDEACAAIGLEAPSIE
jgi:hypothetical protein